MIEGEEKRGCFFVEIREGLCEVPLLEEEKDRMHLDLQKNCSKTPTFCCPPSSHPI